MKIYTDFRFGEKKLSDFGGVIYNKDGAKKTVGSMPRHKILDTGNGYIYYGTSKEPLEFDVDCFFEKVVSEDEINEWICESGEQEFQYIDDEKKIKAVYNGQLDFSIWGDSEGEIERSVVTIPFIAYDPKWY